jgi:hypothetical protein
LVRAPIVLDAPGFSTGLFRQKRAKEVIADLRWQSNVLALASADFTRVPAYALDAHGEVIERGPTAHLAVFVRVHPVEFPLDRPPLFHREKTLVKVQVLLICLEIRVGVRGSAVWPPMGSLKERVAAKVPRRYERYRDQILLPDGWWVVKRSDALRHDRTGARDDL